MTTKFMNLFALILAVFIGMSGCSGFGHSNQSGQAPQNQTVKQNEAGGSSNNSKAQPAKKSPSGTSSSSASNPANVNDQYKQPTVSQLVQHVVSAAKNGKIMGADFTVGKTTANDVKKAWGTPTASSNLSVGTYSVYKKQNVAIGFTGNSPIFDLRSYDAGLHSISLSAIEKVLGKPTNILFYNDAHHHQEILTYAIGNGLQLKWIIPKPTASNKNPKVDHISVYDPKARTNSLVDRMSLDQKIGQLVMVGVDGTTAGSNIKTLLRQYHVGGIILYGKNIKTPGQTVQLINQLKTINAQAGNPLPLFLSTDQEGGEVQRLPKQVTRIPSSGKIGKVDDPHFSYQIGQVIGTELKAFGFNMDFAPVLDVRNPSGTSVIGDRSFGSNKKVVSALGTATMKGIQSKGVVSVVKHFPGYGAATVDAHTGLPKVTLGEDQLNRVDWYPYRNVIANGADAVMVTHILLPKLDPNNPSSMSRIIITGMLRNKLGFQGVIITDDMTMGAIEKHYNINQAAVKAVKAGADIVLVAFNPRQQISVLKSLKHAVITGEISKQQLNDSVRRIIRLKKKFKLSNQAVKNVDVAKLNQQIHAVLQEKF